MKSMLKTCLIAVGALLFASATIRSAAAAELTRVYYPNEAEMAFSVDVPSNWKMIPQEDEDGYFEVEGTDGLELAFRVVPGADIKAATTDHIDYLKENFSDIELKDAVEIKINGLEAILLPGLGVDEDDSKRVLGAGRWR